MSDEDHVLYGPKIEYNLPNISLGEYLLKRLRHHGNKPAQRYVDDGQLFTFSQLADRGLSVAVELQARGIGKGDIVSVCCKLRPEYAAILLGTLFVGATLAPLNYKFDEIDFSNLVNILQPNIIISTPESVDRLKNVLAKLKLKTELVILEDNSSSWSKFLSHKVDSDFQIPKQVDYEDRAALIMCSSGTTGFPKGVTISQNGVMYQLSMFADGVDMFKLDDKVLLFSPPFWASGPILSLSCIDMGLEILLGPQFGDEIFLRAVQDYKATFAFMPPNQALEIAKCPAVERYDLSSLKVISCGGTAMNKESQLLVERALNTRIIQVYGMTEAMVILRMTREDPVKEGSSGKLARNTICKVVDIETGRTLGPNCKGELYFKSPTLTKGYHRNEEATKAIFDKDGWLHSGDIAYYDEDGFFFIVDRMKDLIKYRGDHVAPIEIESQLLEHPAVKDAAVVGVKHLLDQEHPMAVVIKQPGAQITEQELVQYVQNKLTEHKWLRGGVRFVEELPKTPSGKIQRRQVRLMIESGNYLKG